MSLRLFTAVIAVLKAVIMCSVIVLFSIAVNVVRFISLTILIPPRNTTVSKQTNESNQDIDKIVHKTTAGEGGLKLPLCERNKNGQNTN